MLSYRAHLRKMKHQINPDNSIDYQLRMIRHPAKRSFASEDERNLRGKSIKSEDEILEPMNQYIGQKVKIEFQDQINCVACGRKTNKSFGQGHCFPCLQNLAECDTCIIKPAI